MWSLPENVPHALEMNVYSAVVGWNVLYIKSPTYELTSYKLSEMQKCIPPTSGMSEIAVCPPSPIVDDLSALPSPSSSPSSSQ